MKFDVSATPIGNTLILVFLDWISLSYCKRSHVTSFARSQKCNEKNILNVLCDSFSTQHIKTECNLKCKNQSWLKKNLKEDEKHQICCSLHMAQLLFDFIVFTLSSVMTRVKKRDEHSRGGGACGLILAALFSFRTLSQRGWEAEISLVLPLAC